MRARKQLEAGQGLGHVQLVQIVDHQQERVVEQLEVGEQLFDHCLAAEVGGRLDPLDP